MSITGSARSHSREDEKFDAKPQVTVEVEDVVVQDDVNLEHMGYKQEFRRDFSFIGLFSLVSSELAVLPGVAGTIWCVCSRDQSCSGLIGAI